MTDSTVESDTFWASRSLSNGCIRFSAAEASGSALLLRSNSRSCSRANRCLKFARPDFVSRKCSSSPLRAKEKKSAEKNECPTVKNEFDRAVHRCLFRPARNHVPDSFGHARGGSGPESLAAGRNHLCRRGPGAPGGSHEVI